MLTEWVLAIEGTEAGHNVALGLALLAAFLHAVFGALQKGRHDPWVSRAVIDVWIFVLAAPLALFAVPWPEAHLWPILLGALVIHFGYKCLQAAAYTRGAYTVVYPVVRGTGPLFTVFGAYLLFGEAFTGIQWAGVAVLLCGIFGLAAYNLAFLETDRATLRPALWLAVATGLFVALYTTYDAYGIRASSDPFTFLAWFFFVTSLDIPLLVALRQRHKFAHLALRPLMIRGAMGAVIAFLSFGSIMLATRLDKVGEAAILRETSTVFAALIGWLFLRETVGPRRMALMALIAAGAVIVEFGG
ncbi:DMT family transporter [Primorskyibacter sp. S187A]|uniref:DMT family transporter n=1 Tax=Primorskyibacter sp. S187A TaxID=3415130 RepID=UPI003C7CA7A3